MVAKTKIYKGETPLGELQNAFKAEIEITLKDAALKMGCSIERLKYRFNNLGCIEVQKMTIEEMVEKRQEDEKHKRIVAVRNRRNNG